MKETNIIEDPSPIISEEKVEAKNVTLSEETQINLTILHNRTKYQFNFSLSSTISEIKQALEPLTHVPVNMQKLIYRGLLSDTAQLCDLNLPKDAKLMLVGTQLSEVEQVRLSESTNPKKGDDNVDTIQIEPSMDWCEQTEHKKVLERFGKPENALIGIINTEEVLAPDECLVGLYDKRGQPLRLKIKSDSGELWLATKDLTHKFPLSTIHEVVSQPIKDHPEYHIMAFQLGPTPKSRYFVYWLPSQYVESIKTMVLQYKIFNSVGGSGSSCGNGPSL